MKGAIATREAVTLSAGGICVRGTYHKPGPVDGDRIGVLFLSPGVLPRAANGDAAVYWADALAQRGYFCFRFDLPGLGDSDGDFSTQTTDFQVLVDRGTFGPALSEMADRLVERFNLSGLVVAGHCAGAVTTLFAAAGNDRINGLILLDPYFHVQQESEVQNAWVRWQSGIISQLQGSAAGMKVLSVLRGMYRSVSHKQVPVLRKKLPDTANLPLIRCWNQLASAGIPVLILRASSSTPKPGEFDYLAYLQSLSDDDHRVSVQLIERTTHAFSERAGKQGVRTHAEQWLSACFPVTKSAATRDTEPHSSELAVVIPGINAHVR